MSIVEWDEPATPTPPERGTAAGRQCRLLIDGDRHQVRCAILEAGRLAEIYLERPDQRGVVGNVYVGRVSRILPGMQAAFVDIGLKRDAFLYVGDVREALANLDELSEADPLTDEFPAPVLRPIERVLKSGQKILVQVVKAPLPNKGARITTEVTLPGRYLVFVPTEASLGVSRRIRDPEERARLREIIETLVDEEGGLIVRTAGEGRGEAEFSADRDQLAELWRVIQQRSNKATAPSLLHRDDDLVIRIIRDRLTDKVSEVVIDGREAFDRVLRFAEQHEPHLAGRIACHQEEGSLFDLHGIEAEIAAALKSKVWLKSGGCIVINPTEALVAIDVNTGRFIGRNNLEETVVATNLEAVEEIVRQIRLRDLSGIIVIDFIDMVEAENRGRVFEALQAELKNDRAKNQLLELSDFGLVEITRKRSRPNLGRLLTRACPHCSGSGRILALPTICLDLRREVVRRARATGPGRVLVRAHPEVIAALDSEQKEIRLELEDRFGSRLTIEATVDQHVHHFEVVVSASQA